MTLIHHVLNFMEYINKNILSEKIVPSEYQLSLSSPKNVLKMLQHRLVQHF